MPVRRLRPHASLPLLAALLAGCASAPPASLTVRDAGACPLHLQRGQTLLLELPGNPTTGYRWTLVEGAPALLRSLGPEVFRVPDDAPIGGDGVSTWRFQVAGAGNGRLRLIYQRPWESSAEPAGEFDCRLDVE